MSEHPSTERLNRYRQRGIAPSELLALDDHLAECEACRRELRKAVPAQAVLHALESKPLERFLSWLGLMIKQMTDSRLALQVTGAAAALVILLWVFWPQGRKLDSGIALTTATPATSAPLTPTPVTPPPEILVALNDGPSQVALDAQGQLRGLDGLAPADERRVIVALQTRKVETPAALAQLAPSPGVVMGAGQGTGFSLLDPVGKIVFDNRPTLRWKPLGEAASYTVTITDPQNNYSQVAASSPLTSTQWKVDRALRRGRVYAWTVTADRDGQKVTAPSASAGEAKFKVLEQSKADEWSRAEKAYAGSHLTLGLLAAQAGLLDEAERQFRALAAANPQSPVAKAFLRDLETKRR